MILFLNYLVIGCAAFLWGLGGFLLFRKNIRYGLKYVLIGAIIVFINMYLGGFFS